MALVDETVSFLVRENGVKVESFKDCGDEKPMRWKVSFSTQPVPKKKRAAAMPRNELRFGLGASLCMLDDVCWLRVNSRRKTRC